MKNLGIKGSYGLELRVNTNSFGEYVLNGKRDQDSFEKDKENFEKDQESMRKK